MREEEDKNDTNGDSDNKKQISESKRTLKKGNSISGSQKTNDSNSNIGKGEFLRNV